jgi:hypothetical protein
LILGAVRIGSLLLVATKTPSFPMLLSLGLYFSGRIPIATGLIPMRWQVSGGQSPGPPSWNSNAYAIRGKSRNNLARGLKVIEINMLRFYHQSFAAPCGANCVIRVTVEQSPLRR